MFYNFLQELYPLLLISAMRLESSVILKRFSFSKKRIPPGYFLFQFTNQRMFLLETGTGNKIDRHNLELTIGQINPGFIINFGTCGALNDQINLNANYLAKSINYIGATAINLSQDLEKLSGPAKPGQILPAARLLTVDKPVLDSKRRTELWRSTNCDLVDMEAYFVAQIAQKLRISVAILKQVTDYADHGAKQQITKNKKQWQESLYQGLSDILGL